MDRSPGQKISKETQALFDTSDKLDLVDIYWAFHSKPEDFKSAWNILRDWPHAGPQDKPWQIWENWNNLKHLFWSQLYEIRNKLKKKKPLKNTNTKRLNNVLLNNHWITEETQEGVERREPLRLRQGEVRGVGMDS